MIKNLIKRGLITLNRLSQFGQCKYYSTINEYESIYPLGLYSTPDASKENLVLLLSVNADDANLIGIEYNPDRLPDMNDGEVILYNPYNGLHLKFTKDEKISFGSMSVDILEKMSEQLNELSDSLQEIVNHTHTSAAAGSPTGTPLNSATFTNIKTNIETIKNSIDELRE